MPGTTAATFGKSYVYQSEHSLVTVLRHSEPQCFHSDEEADDDDPSSDNDDDESDAALTRLHRFCWAICCCRSCSCEGRSSRSSSLSSSSVREDSDSDDSDKVVLDDTSRCRSCFCLLREKFVELRDRLELAEYGNGHMECEPG